MEEKIIKWLHSYSFIKLFAVISIICIFGLCLLLRIHEKSIETINISNYNVYPSDTIEYSYFFNSLKNTNNSDIYGWLILKGVDTGDIATKIVLKEQNSDVGYIIPTEVKLRKDVTEYINDGHNYNSSGFYSYWDNIPPELDTDSKDYDVYIYSCYNGKEAIIDTELTLSAFNNCTE